MSGRGALPDIGPDPVEQRGRLLRAHARLRLGADGRATDEHSPTQLQPLLAATHGIRQRWVIAI